MPTRSPAGTRRQSSGSSCTGRCRRCPPSRREQDILELLRERYRDLQVHTPYVEWYENSLRFPESPVARFHRERYGERPYASFRGEFVDGGIAQLDPDAWADAFAAAGARYVVFVTKHHDGFCLWPSRVRNPRREGWASPRDCVGGRADLTPPKPPHCDVRTPEYAVFPDVRRKKWECVRGIDKSFGYNRISREEDFLSQRDLIHSFADIVSKNGNLLSNVGPRGEDAAIPGAQLRRLQWLGAWLATNGEAVYGTRPWRRAEGATREGVPVRFTARGEGVYAILLGAPPGPALTLEELPLADGARVELLGRGPLSWRREGGAFARRARHPARGLAGARPRAHRGALTGTAHEQGPRTGTVLKTAPWGGLLSYSRPSPLLAPGAR